MTVGCECNNQFDDQAAGGSSFVVLKSVFAAVAVTECTHCDVKLVYTAHKYIAFSHIFRFI